LIEAVLFDWGGTLVEFEWDDELFLAGHRAGLAAIGSREDPAAFTQRYRRVVFPRVGEPYAGLLRELLGEVSDEEVEAFMDAEHEVWRPGNRVLASAQALLESLRSRGLRTGLVANAWPEPARLLRRSVAEAGLGPLLDVTVFSDEVGARKPDPAIFLCALNELGVQPRHAMFVGDRIETDVQGAARVGMTTVQAMWFRVDDTGGLPEPDFRAFTPMDVLNAVRRVEPAP
jgi:HAD superfamily hydrolase (TIGR01509 family)